MTGRLIAVVSALIVGCQPLLPPDPPAPTYYPAPSAYDIYQPKPESLVKKAVPCGATAEVKKVSAYGTPSYSAQCPGGVWLCKVIEAERAICETTKETYRAEDHERFMAPGTGRVIGEVFARTRGGDVKIGAGETVWLVPESAFFVEVARQFVRGFDLQSAPEVAGVVRQSVCNSRGEFAFSGVPEGRYLVFSRLFWSTGKSLTGSALFGVVEVSGASEVVARLAAE